MKKILAIFFISSCLFVKGQNIQLLKFQELKNRVTTSNDTLYVLNFWATWCKPCVHELPYFVQCDSEYKNKPLKMILVNLDFNSKIETLAEPFVKRKNIHSTVVHITETDPGTWINKVDSSWSGAIPATCIFKNGKKLFFKEGEMTLEELRETLNSSLKKK